ncbi:endonuclease domain-containing protein [Frankia sp. AiPa1]|uniref:endonuclease domain-containing protein n=1 Tax=Frankia sp. AiPa1 TaxID=573492 RepID=UPI00202B24A4|nr:endonuclease domain-containing protein [Frankia sp. AiPa1]MCL9758736.1 endonuclease domain-containing protein [Frankia sp. AiPa1]
MGRGQAFVIEVDGPHHRAQRRFADDRNRDLQWGRCGIHVVRLPVEDLDDATALEARLHEEIRRHLPRR